MQTMHTVVAHEIKAMQLNAHPQDYLNFNCLGKREELPAEISQEAVNVMVSFKKISFVHVSFCNIRKNMHISFCIAYSSGWGLLIGTVQGLFGNVRLECKSLRCDLKVIRKRVFSRISKVRNDRESKVLDKPKMTNHILKL
ncbi:hypothetical protein Tco_1379421, partial [Tanacetum coccineum]